MRPTSTAILVCYDGSESAKHALEVVAAGETSGPVVLLHVWTEPVALWAESFGNAGVPGLSALELEELELERARGILDEGRAFAAEVGLDAATHLKRTSCDEWRGILDVAEALDARLIVLGTRGETALEPNLLGSVSAAVAHHSTRPVMLVPTPVAASVTAA